MALRSSSKCMGVCGLALLHRLSLVKPLTLPPRRGTPDSHTLYPHCSRMRAEKAQRCRVRIGCATLCRVMTLWRPSCRSVSWNITAYLSMRRCKPLQHALPTSGPRCVWRDALPDSYCSTRAPGRLRAYNAAHPRSARRRVIRAPGRCHPGLQRPGSLCGGRRPSGPDAGVECGAVR